MNRKTQELFIQETIMTRVDIVTMAIYVNAVKNVWKCTVKGIDFFRKFSQSSFNEKIIWADIATQNIFCKWYIIKPINLGCSTYIPYQYLRSILVLSTVTMWLSQYHVIVTPLHLSVIGGGNIHSFGDFFRRFFFAITANMTVMYR